MKKDDALSCSHHGSCDDDVLIVAKKGYIAKQLYDIGEDAIAAELKGYGAWDENELSDRAMNRLRIVWIAAGNIKGEIRNV